jgi:hypothetical protein
LIQTMMDRSINHLAGTLNLGVLRTDSPNVPPQIVPYSRSRNRPHTTLAARIEASCESPVIAGEEESGQTLYFAWLIM